MIIDCFMYNGEKRILKLRLMTLYEFVDKFIVFYGQETFKGELKPKLDLNFIDIKYREKIEIVYVPSTPWLTDNWDREFFQKSYHGTSGELFESPDNIIFFGDVDEIWNPGNLAEIIYRLNNVKILPLSLMNSNFFPNYICFQGPERRISGPYVAKSGKTFRILNKFELRQYCQSTGHNKPNTCNKIDGWHLSFLKDPSYPISTKVSHYGHDEPHVRLDSCMDIDYFIQKNIGFGCIGETYWSFVAPEKLDLPDFFEKFCQIPTYLVSDCDYDAGLVFSYPRWKLVWKQQLKKRIKFFLKRIFWQSSRFIKRV